MSWANLVFSNVVFTGSGGTLVRPFAIDGGVCCLDYLVSVGASFQRLGCEQVSSYGYLGNHGDG